MANHQKSLVALGSDHAGFELKNQIKEFLEQGSRVITDCGTHSTDSADYPDYAEKVCLLVREKKFQGILVCGTGIGMCISANKFPGIRAALVDSVHLAKMSRAHNNANVLCLGARVTNFLLAKEIITVWLQEPFEGNRHQLRLDKIQQIEQQLLQGKGKK